MSLSGDKLNGHPSPTDPTPGVRSRRALVGNGWPAARKAQERKRQAGTPAEQTRRVGHVSQCAPFRASLSASFRRRRARNVPGLDLPGPSRFSLQSRGSGCQLCADFVAQ